jgi:hypothetical protein
VEQGAVLAGDRADRGQRLDVPISLLAAMTLTRIVRGVIAARSAARSIRPPASTPSTVTSSPCSRNCRQTSSTDLCSVADGRRRGRPPRSGSAAPRRPFSARLLDSVAPLGERDLAGDGVDERRDLRARLVGGVARVPAERVLLAVGIAEPLGEERQHRLEDPGVHRRRRVVVEIDGFTESRSVRVGADTGAARRAGIALVRHLGRDLGERAGGQRRQDAILDAPERIADVALRELLALLVLRRAGRSP